MPTITTTKALQRALGIKRTPKYRAKPTTLDGLKFASKREANRYAELRLLERAGKIVALGCQPRYALVVDGVLIADYIADFSYCEDDNFVVEDVKSKPTRTRAYIIKRKLLKALYGIDVKEIE